MQTHSLEKKSRVEFLNSKKDYDFDSTMVFNTTKFVLKSKYFVKP